MTTPGPDSVTIQLLSDIHLEFYDANMLSRFFSKIDPTGVDVLVLAGDICGANQLDTLLPLFSHLYEDSEVVYVTGNHEYYGAKPELVHEVLGTLERDFPNFTWLHNRATTIRGLRFVGGTLWFPKPDAETLVQGQTGINDYRLIHDFEPWVYRENFICEAVLKHNLATADVVVTHHIPMGRCLSPRFGTSHNHFFCRDLTPLVEEHQPPLWLFGHTHDRMWARVGRTLVASNPLGYPHEPNLDVRGKYAEPCLIKYTKGEATFAEGSVPGEERK